MRITRPTGIKMLKFKRLYREAFPKSERKPFSVIKRLERENRGDVLYFEEDGKFLGMATTVRNKDTLLIDYFAVSRKMRGRGYGSKMLRELVNLYTDKGVFLEIERISDGAPNNDERIRRKKFYENIGFSEMGVYIELFGVEMELLGYNTSFTFDEYLDFYVENIGEFARDHIKEL